MTIESGDPVGETARQLIGALCTEMSARYGTPPSPFSPDEAAAPRAVFLVAKLGGEAVGCGALRRFDDDVGEIKRMYVAPAGRRRGIARRILNELERQARAFGYRALRLETGILQPEAQQLYVATGFRRIDAFGPYVGNPTSLCFEKQLTHADRSAEAVVQRQLDAYNARDLDGLMATYAEDAQQFEYPSTLLAHGSVQIRERFAARLQEPNLQARLLHRSAIGNTVIDHEEVTRTFPEGPGRVELIAIYEVRDGRIQTARFISARKVIGPTQPPATSDSADPCRQDEPRPIRIRRVIHEPAVIDSLADVLVDCVDGGASIGFMAPLPRSKAVAFWEGVVASAARGERILLVAEEADTGAIVGTVQVVLTMPDNQPHRADIAKMQVHRRARRRGVGAALMRAAEAAALEAGRTLLVLDTVTGGDAERLYTRLGWRRCGEIPNFALWPRGGFCTTTVFYRRLAPEQTCATCPAEAAGGSSPTRTESDLGSPTIGRKAPTTGSGAEQFGS